MKVTLSILAALALGALLFLYVAYPNVYPSAEDRADTSPSIGTPAPGNEGNYPEPESKLNIVEICQSALAYMTFSSGAEADAFVEACIRGEHPEVIEQWKVQMGITDDRVI